MLNFGNSKEEVKKGRTRVSCGVHHVKIESFELKAYDSGFKKVIVHLSCVKTLQGLDSAGLIGQFDIIMPTGKTQESLEKNADTFMKRLRHIFNKCAGSAKIDSINTWFDKLSVESIEELATKFEAAFKGKEMHLKFIAKKTEGNDGSVKYYPEVPYYIHSICECADVTKSSLVFDPIKEDLPKIQSSRVENAATTAADTDDLPF